MFVPVHRLDDGKRIAAPLVTENVLLAEAGDRAETGSSGGSPAKGDRSSDEDVKGEKV